MKYIALALIGTGILLLIVAFRMDATSSFEGGGFLGEMAGIIAGGVLIAIGVIWLLVLAFLGSLIMQIDVKMSFNALKVRFDDVTHLRIDVTKLIGHQSWREGYGNRKFVIEYTTAGGQIICEYDTESKWKEILDGLDRALDGPSS